MELEVYKNNEDADMYKILNDERDTSDKWNFFTIKNDLKKYWGYDCATTEMSIKPNTINEYGHKGSELVFTVSTKGWLDPSSLHLSLDILNGSGRDFKFDGSAHSIFNEFKVLLDGVPIESYYDYGRLHKFESELRLNREDRKKRKNEGFGTNENGDDEMTIPYDAKKDVSQKDLYNPIKYPEMSKEDVKLVTTNVKLKVESCIFGNKLSKDNWKIIPLDSLKLQFVYKLSPKFGFFERTCKFKVVENDSVKNHVQYKAFSDKYSEAIKDTNKVWPLNGELSNYINLGFVTNVVINTDTSNKLQNIKILKPLLKFKKYEFSDEWEKILVAEYKKTGMYFEINSFQVLLNKWVDDSPSNTNLNFMLREDSPKTRAFYVVAYSSEHEDSSFKRPFARVNAGFTKMQIQTEHSYWPEESAFDKTEVYNPSGNHSIEPILHKCMRLNNISEIDWDNTDKSLKYKYVLGRENMSCSADCSTFGLDLIDDKNKTVEIKETTNRKTIGACKWLNMISFDAVPYSNDKVIGGMKFFKDTASNILLKKTIQASMNKWLSPKQYNLYLIIEKNERLRMDIDGKITLITD